MDKSTKLYEIPDDPSQFHNPVFSIVIPDFLKHKFNTNMLPVFMFDSNPEIAIYSWPLLFLIGLTILVKWYSKLYPLPDRKTNFYIPAIGLLITYVILLIPINNTWNSEFTLNTSGMFGGWDHYKRAANYTDIARNAKEPAKKAQYYSLSAQEYKITTKLWPGYPESFLYLGICYNEEGYPDSATGALKYALQIAPGFAPAENSLGMIYLKNEQYDTAIKYFNNIYAVDSNNREAILNIAKCYQKENKYALAACYYGFASRL
jgi:tetratricopeptide (TPR) repeat protein